LSSFLILLRKHFMNDHVKSDEPNSIHRVLPSFLLGTDISASHGATLLLSATG
jgi:hypothetical protein